jgi:hypothetical protein
VTSPPPPRPPRSVTAPPPISNIPELGLPFQGRDEQIAALLKLFSQYSHVLLHDAVAPVQGFGKTQMAIAYCRRYTRRYDVAWWFECEGETDDNRLCGLIDHQYQQLREECARTYGQDHDRRPDKHWLFVYDNVPNPDRIYEHFVPGTGHRLVTSRSPGDTWGKNRLELSGLSTAVAEGLLLEHAQGELEGDQAEFLAQHANGHPAALLTAAEGVLRFGYDRFVGMLAPPPQTDPDTPPHGLVMLPKARSDDACGTPLSQADKRTLIEALLRSPVGGTRETYELWLDSVRLSIKPTQLTPISDTGPMRNRIIAIVNFALNQPTSKVLAALADALEEQGTDAAIRDVRRLVDKGVAAWNHGRRR